MSIYPTRTAAHLAIAGVVVLGAGIALREHVVVAWGGAILVAIALARAVTLVSVMRIRAAGFEMLWSGSLRVARTLPGGVVILEAEVRNRDTLAARYDKLRVVASPALETWVEPLAGEVYATGSVKLKVHVRALRIGYHGIYGLALEVRGAPGMFEVPLTFANPFGIEVLPRSLARPLMRPHGGRSRSLAMAGGSGTQRGDGTDLRELREHQPGDPFRRIAWKASARRGVLVVREFEREERDVVMLVLDASVELWAGPMGGSPLDRAVDLATTLAAHHLDAGDLVGLAIIGARSLAQVAPDSGRPQASRIVTALMEHTGVLDADRSGWDESDVAVQVTEHLRPLDPRALADLKSNRIDKLVKRASSMRGHAPFDRPAPRGRNPLDVRLRRYAACFGIHVPARLEPDKARTTQVLVATLLAIAKQRKRPRVSVVHVVAPPPGELEALGVAARRLKARGMAVRWSTPPVAARLTLPPPLRADLADVIPPPEDGVRPDPATFEVVQRAVVMRAAFANRRGETALRKLGFEVVRAIRSPSAGADRTLDPAGHPHPGSRGTPAPGVA